MYRMNQNTWIMKINLDQYEHEYEFGGNNEDIFILNVCAVVRAL